MDVVTCPACEKSDGLDVIAYRATIQYRQCHCCGTIYTRQNISRVIDNENDNSLTRNGLPINVERIRRAERVLGKKLRTALDFGCGLGFLVSNMRAEGIIADGIDRGTELKLGDVRKQYYECVFMIEVIEHLYNPKAVLTKLAESLVPNGVIMVETTFADQIDEMFHPYVNPIIGHVTILSRAGLSYSLPSTLRIEKFLNPNVAILKRMPI